MLSGEERAAVLRRVSAAAVGIACLLIAVKALAFWRTDSTAVLGALLDSCMDAIASLVNFFALRHATTPADHDHRFGHGKAEPLAGLAQSLFIGGSAIALFWRAASTIGVDHNVSGHNLGMASMVIALFATGVLVLLQRRAIRLTQSKAIEADLMHYAGDLGLHLGVMVALLLDRFFALRSADAAFGFGIAVWMGFGSWRIARSCLAELMDEELPAQEREKILSIARNHPETDGAHALRTRRSGGMTFIQLHLELGPQVMLIDAHRIGLEVETSLKAAIVNADVLIHFDPEPDDHEEPS